MPEPTTCHVVKSHQLWRGDWYVTTAVKALADPGEAALPINPSICWRDRVINLTGIPQKKNLVLKKRFKIMG